MFLGFITSFSYASDLVISTKNNIYSDKRYELMKQYSKVHYGLDHADLIKPQMIVIHYTALPNLELSMKAFKEDKIPEYRTNLTYYGDVNVGAHFLVDIDGTIYELLPLTMMGRHVIGYNYTAIGIENVSGDGSGLTNRQVEANAALVLYLTRKLPSIKYLLGHHEYMNQTYPHFKLFKELDTEYQPTIKLDPGFNFMEALRKKLKYRDGIILEK